MSKRWRCLALAATLFISAEIATPADTGRRIALVIGVGEYDHLSALRGPATDAIRMTQWLLHAGYETVSLPRSDSGDSPRLGDLKSAMDEIAHESGPVDEVLLYFSGHGATNGESERLCLADATPDGSMGTIGLNQELIPWIRNMHPKLGVILVDACRNEDPAPPLPTMPGSPQMPTGKMSLLILQAAAPGASSSEMANGSGGYFTQTLLDAFVSTDGSLGSLVDFVSRNLPARTLAGAGIAQVPGIGGDYDPTLKIGAVQSEGTSRDFLPSDLIITTVPSGAEIWCGSRRIGVAPLVWHDRTIGSLTLTARLGELSAECEIERSPAGPAQVNMLLGKAPGRVFFGTDRKLLEYSIDGGPFRPFGGEAWVQAAAGRRNVRVTAEGSLYWEGTIEIASDRTIQVIPDFVKAGQISVELPKGALLYLHSLDGSRDYLFAESSKIDTLPVGNYHAETADEMYEKWSGDFSLGTGARISISPHLLLSQHGRDFFELQGLKEDLPRKKRLRHEMNIAGWFLLGTSGLLATSGIFSAFELSHAVNDYSLAVLGSDFGELRSRVFSALSLTTILFSASALSGTLGLSLFPLGPRPETIEGQINRLNAKLSAFQEVAPP